MKGNIASIKARLKKYSKQEGRIHQFTLIRYFQERLLYRLSKSEYRNHFLLKGGALVYALQKESSRNTLDIDLLAKKLKADGKELVEIFREVCDQEFEDGVTFDLQNILAAEIIKEGNYSGIRIKIPAKLGTIQQSMQIDIGFGDSVTPGPIEMDYPTLLDMEKPNLLVYSIESLIAEKFHAMIDLAEYNSRMKDFYDVYTILNTNSIDKNTLKTAIQNTFKRRNTKVRSKHSLFTLAFHKDKSRNNQWLTFLKKSKLNSELTFTDVLRFIKEELEEIYLSLVNDDKM